MKVIGPRVLVKEDEVTTGVEVRARESGLHVVIDEKNRPRPTSGRVIQLGTDPLFAEWGLKEGAHVTFGPHAGEFQYIEGQKFRLLEFHEIKMILDD